LILRGRELGAHPLRITSKLKVGDICAEKCDRAVLNGEEIPLPTLSSRLSQMTSDVCKVVLSSGNASSEFKLDFRIAAEGDLIEIEREFKKIASRKRLDIQSIEDFIAATSRFESAIGYCDGICAYLYGVLAKERAPDSSLDYDAYVGKYNAAADQLAAYERPLARAIGSLIEFHFNHFNDSVHLAGHSRVGVAASRYLSWLLGKPLEKLEMAVPPEGMCALEGMVADWATEQITRWAVRSLTELSVNVDDMEVFLTQKISELDRVKVQILLSEVYSFSGDIKRSIQLAKGLRNHREFENWAEEKIRAHSGG
jgi:hypothetical protein